jgi:hypothetical protein
MPHLAHHYLILPSVIDLPAGKVIMFLAPI